MNYEENSHRAARAAIALGTSYLDDHDERTAVVDLLCDLRHYCDQNGIDMGAADNMAHQHYLAELEGE